MHIHTKYEVSILNPVARRAVHKCQCRCHQCQSDDTDNYALRTNHDYIGSFGRIPNEPINVYITSKFDKVIMDTTQRMM